MSWPRDANGSPVEGEEHVQPSPLPTLVGIRENFPGFKMVGRDPFPAHLCKIPSTEKGVLDSSVDHYHLVLIVDNRFDCNGRIARMKPYTAEDPDGGGLLYGWVDRDGNFDSHGECPVNELDYAKVVAWKPCTPDFDLRA